MLEMTLKSFSLMNDYPITEYIIVDDSGDARVHEEIKRLYHDYTLILEPNNRGQVICIDDAYSRIKTKYIFHCEDDWKFIKPHFIEDSLIILESDPMIMQVWLNNINNHPITEKRIVDNLEYGIADWNKGTFGMSWNPGLRRLNDYKKIAPFIKWANPPDQPNIPLHYLIATSVEWYAGEEFVKMGYRTAVLNDIYCEHIGVGRHIR